MDQFLFELKIKYIIAVVVKAIGSLWVTPRSVSRVTGAAGFTGWEYPRFAQPNFALELVPKSNRMPAKSGRRPRGTTSPVQISSVKEASSIITENRVSLCSCEKKQVSIVCKLTIIIFISIIISTRPIHSFFKVWYYYITIWHNFSNLNWAGPGNSWK